MDLASDNDHWTGAALAVHTLVPAVLGGGGRLPLWRLSGTARAVPLPDGQAACERENAETPCSQCNLGKLHTAVATWASSNILVRTFPPDNIKRICWISLVSRYQVGSPCPRMGCDWPQSLSNLGKTHCLHQDFCRMGLMATSNTSLCLLRTRVFCPSSLLGP